MVMHKASLGPIQLMKQYLLTQIIDDVHYTIDISLESCTNELVLIKDIAFRLLEQGKLFQLLLSLKNLEKYYSPGAAIQDQNLIEYLSKMSIDVDLSLKFRDSDKETDALIECYQEEKSQIGERMIPLAKKMYAMYCADSKWLETVSAYLSNICKSASSEHYLQLQLFPVTKK